MFEIGFVNLLRNRVFVDHAAVRHVPVQTLSRAELHRKSALLGRSPLVRKAYRGGQNRRSDTLTTRGGVDHERFEFRGAGRSKCSLRVVNSLFKLCAVYSRRLLGHSFISCCPLSIGIPAAATSLTIRLQKYAALLQHRIATY